MEKISTKPLRLLYFKNFLKVIEVSKERTEHQETILWPHTSEKDIAIDSRRLTGGTKLKTNEPLLILLKPVEDKRKDNLRSVQRKEELSIWK